MPDAPTLTNVPTEFGLGGYLAILFAVAILGAMTMLLKFVIGRQADDSSKIADGQQKLAEGQTRLAMEQTKLGETQERMGESLTRLVSVVERLSLLIERIVPK